MITDYGRIKVKILEKKICSKNKEILEFLRNN